jgi:hypothetical protein
MKSRDQECGASGFWAFRDLEANADSPGDIAKSEAEVSPLHQQHMVQWRTSLLAVHWLRWLSNPKYWLIATKVLGNNPPKKVAVFGSHASNYIDTFEIWSDSTATAFLYTVLWHSPERRSWAPLLSIYAASRTRTTNSRELMWEIY